MKIILRHINRAALCLSLRYQMPFMCGFAIVIAGTFGCDSSVNIPAASTGDTISLANDVQPFLTEKCASCHSAGSLASNFGISLLLTAGDTVASSVNQPSDQAPAFTLVVPGDASSSLLFLKVTQSDPPVGSRMPILDEALTSEELGLLRDWIDQGALDN